MLQLVVDTNLFHEFRSLEELPWADLGERDEIVLLVTDVVITELDEHKKSTRARLKRTAIKITKQFREMTLAGQDDMAIQDREPRVILRLDDTGYGTDNYGKLDYSVLDDQLVGTAKMIADRSNDGTVHLFSNDTRPLRKARAIGLPMLDIPEEWRRVEERTDEDIEHDELKAENKRLKSQEPVLVLKSDVPKTLEVTLSDYPALTDDEVETLLEVLLEANPKETNFQRDHDSPPKYMGLGRGITQSEFKPASSHDIQQYSEFDYPNWVSSCRELLVEAHIQLGRSSRKFDMKISLDNTGTRPAKDVLFTIKTKGALSIMPPPYRDDEDVDEAFDSNPDVLEFPKGPKAPQGSWRQIRGVSDLIRGMNLIETRGPDRSLAALAAFQRPTPARNPNHFYYANRPDNYVREFKLTCSQFRHTGDAEHFDCHCWVNGEVSELEGKSAIIVTTVEAANLSDQVEHKISVRFKSEAKSTFDEVREIIELHNFSFKNG